MRRKLTDWIWPIAGAALIVAFVLGVLSVSLTLQLMTAEQRIQGFDNSVRTAQVNICAPLRTAMLTVEHEQIKSSAKVKASYFPNILPAVFRRLVKAQEEAQHKRIVELEAVNCEAAPPPSP